MQTQRRLPAHRQMTQDQSRTHLVAKALEGTTAADVRHINYLWNLHQRLQGDVDAANNGEGARTWPLVEVIAFDGSWRVDLLVYRIEADTQSVFTRIVAEYDWSEDKGQAVDLSGSIVEWGGPTHRWRVVRNGELLKHGFITRAEAEAWATARGAAVESKGE
jgi:hypothetical protein